MPVKMAQIIGHVKLKLLAVLGFAEIWNFPDSVLLNQFFIFLNKDLLIVIYKNGLQMYLLMVCSVIFIHM
jgi:uncharacterized membrane protein